MARRCSCLSRSASSRTAGSPTSPLASWNGFKESKKTLLSSTTFLTTRSAIVWMRRLSSSVKLTYLRRFWISGSLTSMISSLMDHRLMGGAAGPAALHLAPPVLPALPVQEGRVAVQLAQLHGRDRHVVADQGFA